MKIRTYILTLGFCAVTALNAGAQSTTELEALRKQLEETRRSFDQTVRQQQQVIEALQKRLETLEAPLAKPHEEEAGHGHEEDDEHPHTEEEGHAHGAHAEDVHEPDHEDPHKNHREPHPAIPLRVGSEDRHIDISLDGLFAVGTSTTDDIELLQPGGHDPNQRGFTVQNIELEISGAVEPYFTAQGYMIFLIDGEGETVVELEEAFAESSALPWNLELRIGHYFSEFGRHNPTHPHVWPTVDQPLANARFFGGDGLRNPGARLSWKPPTPFQSELFFSVQDSQGETAESFRNEKEGEVFFGRVHEADRVSSPGDLLFVPRYAASFRLSDTQTIMAGVSAAFGPNASGEDTDTQIYGVDLLWKWIAPNADHGFPFVSWQTEGLLRKYEAGAFSEDLDGNGSIDVDVDEDGILDTVPGETLTDYGFYSQISYGFKPGWVAGFRGGYVGRSERAEYETEFGDDPERADRWRLSPSLTWSPSHFSKVRLQYNFDQRDNIGDDHSVWMQFEFTLGSHDDHTF